MEKHIPGPEQKGINDHFKLMADLSFEGIAIHKDGTLIDANAQYFSMFGYQRDELIGKDVIPLTVVPDSTEKTQKQVETGSKSTYEAVGLRKDGSRFPIEISAKHINHYGQMVRVAVIRDITQQKKAQELILESQERYRLVFESADVMISVYDRKGVCRLMNRKVADLFGGAPEQFIGKTFKELHPGDDHEYIQRVRDVIDSGISKEYEDEVIFPKGSRWLLSKVHPIYDSRNDLTLAQIISQDITDRKKAELALQESEALLIEAQRIGRFGNWTWDILTNQVHTSKETYKIFGFDNNHILTFEDFIHSIHPHDREMVQNEVEKALYEKKSYNLDHRMILRSGKTIFVNESAEVIYDSSGAPVRMNGVVQDITVRKLAEKAVLKSESKYKKLIQTASDSIYLISAEGRILDVNEQACSMLNYSRNDMLKLDISDIDPNFSVDQFLRFWKPISLNSPQIFETRHQRKDGSLISVEVSAQKFAIENETFYYGIARDITERKINEKQLKDSEEKFRTLVNTAPFGIQLSDLEGRIVYSNPAHHKLQGEEPNNLTGRYIWDLTANDSLREKTRDYYRTIISRQPEPTVFFNKGKTRDGREIDVKINWDYIRSETDEVTGIISIIEDITERRQADAERERLLDQLNQAQKMESVGRLAGGVAHDFNNMLGVILGHTELALLQADEQHDLYSDLKEIQTAATRSASITKQLLAFARKQSFSPRQLDLNDTLESMLKMLHRLIGEDIDLVWNPGARIWPVKMDPSQIDQILANLCINARDAISGTGKIAIKTGKDSFDDDYCKEHPGFIPGDFVLLAVSDSGCGMDKDTLDNLFEPFFTTKEVGKGTGLGLSTVYGIVKQNKGFIHVRSEPGQGSAFYIYIPRSVADEHSEKPVSEKDAAAGGTETILLVEDEPSILRMTRMMLERNGYSVLSAATPAEALQKTRNHSGAIDLLMTDVIMPGMNGRDLAEKITTFFPGTRLLFMSGYTADVIAHQGVLDDGVAFIQKPFTLTDLSKKVREVLDNAGNFGSRQ